LNVSLSGSVAVLRRCSLLLQTSVAWSVGLSVTVVSLAQTAELIEMPFVVWIQVGPGNHVLDRGADPLCVGAILKREGIPLYIRL